MSIKKQIKIPKDSLVASDWHFGHDKDFLFSPRGFESKEDHQEYIKEHISSIPEDKTLVFCGDFALTSSVEEVKDFLLSIKCKVYMIWGNHNGFLSKIYKEAIEDQYNKSSIEVYPICHASYPNIVFLGDSASFKVFGRSPSVFAQHFPNFVWDRESYGRIHICGHSHGNLPQTNGEDKSLGKIMDVGVEMSQIHNDGKPYMTFDQVFEYTDKISIQKKDHH